MPRLTPLEEAEQTNTRLRRELDIYIAVRNCLVAINKVQSSEFEEIETFVRNTMPVPKPGVARE